MFMLTWLSIATLCYFSVVVYYTMRFKKLDRNISSTDDFGLALILAFLLCYTSWPVLLIVGAGIKVGDFLYERGDK